MVPKLEARYSSLASILVRWGRFDVAERVLRDNRLAAHRTVDKIHPAFQEAVQRALCERDFNVKLIHLLGASACCALRAWAQSCIHSTRGHARRPQ